MVAENYLYTLAFICLAYTFHNRLFVNHEISASYNNDYPYCNCTNVISSLLHVFQLVSQLTKSITVRSSGVLKALYD